MSKVTAFVKANPFKSGMAIGTVGGAAFAVAMLAVEWPEADVDALREAAEIWEDLADTVERSGKDANGIVESIWKNNSSRGMEVFKEVWERKVEKYPADVATYCRAVARACRDYAQVVETIRHVLIVLAVQMWVNILFTIAWGWGTAGVSTVVQKQLIEKVFKGRAVLQMKIFKLSVEKIIFNAFYYLGDSLVYAGGQQALQWGIFELAGVKKDLNGTEVTSFKENREQFERGFASTMVFNGVLDLAILAPGAKYIPAPRMKAIVAQFENHTNHMLARLLSSGTYTAVDNTLAGDAELPTWEQWIAKLIIHGARSTKPVAPAAAPAPAP
ncbi:WXG100-like domain-containing protein [Streptosporangium sp. NBC_01756]|uniref:WXG100-like domain-containing protein n=1 Tax=Streptosporangium sp. NBC_01756 TaxID=2975950 RepID=UPI002DDB9B23|nr:hypothetical protein [Streptosporangium sp. NBC_01756]WSC89750.1 hypothetical protein OIE48_16670 [Streptosporangium sp. NBC_01756]